MTENPQPTWSFDRQMRLAQTAWRESNVATREQGTQNGKRRPWILPKDHWWEGLWPGIRTGSEPDLEVYLAAAAVRKHQGVHNLKSSWVVCANLYFAHGADTKTLAGFLAQSVDPRIARVDAVELEWAENPPLDPASLLGEPGGRRGAGQTSPDVAFLVELTDGGRGLVLTEVKFTEHSFYGCAGRKSGNGNPRPERCLSARNVLADPASHCHLMNWAQGRRRNRRYWEYLPFTEAAKDTLRACPAATSGYQLLRQHALAEAIAKNGKYDLVYSAVAYDARNDVLLKSMRTAGVPDITRDWGELFDGRARFASFSHQQWVDWVREGDHGDRWSDWIDWVNERYGY